MSPQQSIAHYRIVSKIGEGGMGAVYRAADTKLGRDVAIKVLPEAFAQDAARMARFEREAQVLASLNHPNIAAIYGVEQSAIVMELVEGEELKGPVPVDTAIAYAKQLAAALEAAHEKGIVHRDLKPANIKITPEGVLKVLDFGLAKAAEERSAPSAASPTMSPTLSLQMTQAGVILGTAAYMPPEQARGKAVDKRADIWAFGVVLYEMLTGATMFAGETVNDLLIAVATREPDWSALPEDTPAPVVRLLRRCLVKDPKFRLRDIGEARIALDSPGEPELARAAAPPVGNTRLAWAVAALMTLCAAAAGGIAWRASRPVDMPLTRFLVDLGPDSVPGSQLTAALSPDGRRIAYTVRGADGLPQLATRLLNESAPLVLPGTSKAEQPFFSPDGEWIGFFAGEEMKKISVHGGAAVTLCQTTAPPRGGAWLPDGTIVANLDNLRFYRVPDSGGKPQPLGDPSQWGERTWRWPQSLGNGLVLLTAGVSRAGYEDANMDVLSLPTGKVKTVAKGGYFPRYLPSGHLVYLHEGTLFAVKFDIGRLETRGSPIPILDDVAGIAGQGGGQFDFSRTGTLVYLNGKNMGSIWTLKWVDPAGKLEPAWVTPTAVLNPKISPDGTRVAGALSTGPGAPGGGLQIYDLQRGIAINLTQAGSGRSVIWAHDGRHLVYSGGRDDGSLGLWWIRADGSGAPIELYQHKGASLRATSASPDGRHVAFWQTEDDGHYSVWLLPLDITDPEHPRPGTPELFVDRAVVGAFSPDGRWFAYNAFATENGPIFVRPYPKGEGQWQVSAGNGAFPVWSPKGGELFYRSAAGQLMSVRYGVRDNVFEAAKPEAWSPAGSAFMGSFSTYDVAPDGKRILVYPAVAAGNDSPVRVTMLLNFFDELKRKLP